MTQTIKATAKQIRDLNLTADDVIQYDFITKGSTHHYLLTINGEPRISFTKPQNRHLAKCKIQRMGFGWGVNNKTTFESLMNT